MSDNEAREKNIALMRGQKSAFERLFATKDGKVVLGVLQTTFKNKILFSPTEFETCGKAAQHDVVMYIENMIKEVK